jgi:hypothetical protein
MTTSFCLKLIFWFLNQIFLVNESQWSN